MFQVWPIFFLSYLAYKLLKRARNRATYSLSTVFIFIAFAYALISLSAFLFFLPMSYFLYIVGLYFFVLGNCFFVIFSWVLVRLEEKSPYWMYSLWVTFYGVLSSYIILLGYFFDGIRYDSSTGWIPTYNWFFLALSWLIFSVFIVIPQIPLSIRLIKVFEGKVLKKRIYWYLICVFFEFSLAFAAFLYNTWVDNQIYRFVYVFIFPPLGSIGAYLIYRSFIKELD
ncbi:MAG: hypothetical protein EAX91_04240 [Candidatus Lokiarchaeota archaeon]|nr:hypothetical protein [Candidatus Lokiarchaeota archaeon]